MTNDMTPLTAGRGLELTEFFEGRTTAWGLFEDRFGKVRRRFRIEIHGRWSDEQFLLEESFDFDDGEKDHRVWRISATKDGTFSATCPECIGTAIAHAATDSLTMAYAFRLKLKSRTIDVDCDDRFYRIDRDTVMNRTTMRKWGVKLGELSIFFQRPADQCAWRPVAVE
jgi:hypothetical protein